MNKLCDLEQIKRSLVTGYRYQGHKLLVIHTSSSTGVYHNRCPHMGVNLDWQDNNFLVHDNAFLVCTLHGALFNLDDGMCIGGPCSGQPLQAVDFELTKAGIFITEELGSSA